MKFYKGYDLIKKPIITEKSTKCSENNKYVFHVDNLVTKKSLKKLLESIFNIKISSINMLYIKGKIKKFKGVYGKRSDIKKAIVTLSPGYSIDLASAEVN
ncbi:50S ribosomal protein L23 [Rickettsia endosymbiont of Cardiosporidium cionae]|uniref:50S ribosomal protein L23 n=1 Tax=Rickettsia endosymbiont of Cardiosporidium cionae TaxID=2777155 RepID=UPI001893154E|nr:50S ribosomal protein L23 [Rickettsia endosymbiont of Cardiosporidium cionae]KAF8818200.1 50S ribosomal protein L23 [Rickettsia endosymbiont of Cardiosporidium cionae]